MYLLDDDLEHIGEAIFPEDRNTISPRSIVVLELLYKADEIKSLVSGLNVPVYTY
jgi:hypothetical protein